MPQRSAARALQLFVDAIFFLCFGSIFVRLLAKGAVYIDNMPAQPSNRAALLIGLVWLGVLLVANGCMQRFAHTAVGTFFSQRRGALLCFGALLAAQLVIALSCYSTCGWDPQVLLTTANELLTGVPYTGTYFHQNPNNLFLLGCYRLFFVVLNRLGVTNYVPWVVAVGALLVWLSVLFLFLLVRRLFGVRTAWLSFLLCAPMAALSPWIAVPYSDTFGMPFVIGVLYLYVMARETKHPVHSAVWAVACGVWLSVGVRIKPTVVLIAVAAVVIEVICSAKKTRQFVDKHELMQPLQDAAFAQPAVAALAMHGSDSMVAVQIAQQTTPQAVSQRHKATTRAKCATVSRLPQSRPFVRLRACFTRRALLRTAVCFLLGAMVSYGACGWFQQRATGKVLDPARAQQEKFSATHYFMMGFSQPYGSYAYEDMKYTESIKGSAAKAKANLTEAARRVSEMGPAGYVSFLWRKLLFNFSDGTFFFGREGSFYWGDVPQQGPVALAMQSVFRADQPVYGLLAVWQQAQWMLCLLLMLCGVFYRTGKHAKWFCLARVCVLGLVCFLLVFEARSRYVYHFVPVLCLAALAGLLLVLRELRVDGD